MFAGVMTEVLSAVHVPHKRHLPQRVAVDGGREVFRRLKLVRLAQGQREVVLHNLDRLLAQNSHHRLPITRLQDKREIILQSGPISK